MGLELVEPCWALFAIILIGMGIWSKWTGDIVQMSVFVIFASFFLGVALTPVDPDAFPEPTNLTQAE